ncbi:collagen alpha-1(II) chain-like isoform X6 [Tympanuchus pallidicinctus]|uniref:collagen alpha-1(II) chain-like isoform X6 n=1 Tax=Tympanuchus pallidicinctus TaxID=109042 RepID=UPI0022870A2B|nr:collagen alpha-1(II) chain-like isoform X6 [Tympanuchus pallidicinctus]
MRTLSLLEQNPAIWGAPSVSSLQQRSAGTRGRACSASPDTVSVRGTAGAPTEGRALAADPSLGGSRPVAPHTGLVERGVRSCWGSRWGSRSSSSSVCTADVAARCWEDTGGIYEEEEDDGSGQDGALLPWQCPEQDESPELMRRGSLESLGARISRLSQSGAETPCLASSKHPAQGRGDASHWGPHSKAKPSVTSLHGGDGEAGHLRRPSSSSASRSRARAVGHHRWQELPARRGWHGGDFILTAKKEDGDGRRRALCECAVGLGVRGAEAGVQEGSQGAWWGQGPPWGWVMVGPCGSEGGQPRASPTRWWVRGVPNLLLQAPMQQRDLLGDAAPGQRGSMGCPAQGMQQSPGGSTGSRRPSCPTGARAWDHVEKVQGQKGCAGCPGNMRRKMLHLREEKRELQERLCGLELQMRSVLRQRQEALGQLRAVLRKERMAALQQLQESLEKVNGAVCQENCHLQELAAPGALKEPPAPARALRDAEINSASSLSPSTVPGLQQHQRGVPGVLHHIQRCLWELQRFLMPHLAVPASPNGNKLTATIRTRDEAWRRKPKESFSVCEGGNENFVQY